MKINKEMSRVKKITKINVIASEAWQSRRMTCLKAGKPISLLLALTIILSLFLVAVPMAGIAEATDYYVRTDGNDGNDGSANDVEHAWLTIQHAVDTVVAGGTINVADGIYTITTKILVNKAGITVSGNTANPENVVVQYSPTEDSLMFDMRASNATIQGIKTTGGKAGFWFDQSTVTGCTISNCIVDFIREYGIYMKNGGSGHTIDSCTISNTGQTYAGAPAVLIENCLDVTFSNNTLSSISDKGVYVRVCNADSVANRVEVTGNTLSGCDYSCIQVYQSPYTYIYNNTISSTSDKGLNIIGPNASSQAARVVVEGNNISGCPWGGILLTHDKYTYIYNNTISTEDKGISIANGENVNSSAERIIVEGNNVSGTKYPGIQVAYAVPYTYIYNNTLSGCNYYGADGSGDWDYASIHVAENCGNTIVDSNDISDGINGIQIWSNNCTVTNNTIYGMGLSYAGTKGTGDGTYYNSGIIIGSNWLTDNFKPTGTTITDNNIHDNYWGLYIRDYETLSPSDSSVLNVTAEENWWGDASGPKQATTNPSATGDEVSDNVDYAPWYIDAGMTTLSNEANIISYKFEAANNAGVLTTDVTGTVVLGDHTVALTVPYGADVTALVATFTLSDESTAKVGEAGQVSGTTDNNFSSAVTYTITSQDGTTTQDWVVTVTIAAPGTDPTLSDLTLSAGTLNPAFDSATTDYTTAVANSVTSITVTPTATDTNATIKVNDVTVASDSASNTISLDVGENTITIIVTAQDETTKTYTVTVTRAASNDATLSNLTVDETTISGFSPSALTYNKVLPYGTTEVPTVAATTTDSNAAKVITQAVNVTGTEEERTATVVVTAEDGTTTKTYKVIFGSINVTITKTGPTTANQGNNIIYTITYKNVGTFDATGVVITETYPSEVEYVSATPAPDSGTNNQWTIPTLAPGAEGTITVTVHIK